MTTPTITIRQDGPPQAPIAVTNGVPVPKMSRPGYCAALREAFSAMKVGQHFDVDSRSKLTHAYLIAHESGVSITTRKLNNAGWRVWRVKRRVKIGN